MHTFDELWTLIATTVLPSAAIVEAFHERLKVYCERPDAVFVIRQVAGLERRDIVGTAGGLIRPSDNSPAWCVHAMLRDGDVPSDDQMIELVRTIPTHMFDVRKFGRRTANADRLYVAHIYPAKNRDTAWQAWTRSELVKRFIRNVHPCNLFFVPLAQKHWGEESAVIAAIAERMAIRYATVWSDFLRLAEAAPFPKAGPVVLRSRPVAALGARPPQTADAVVRYASSRLDFRRDVIEPLEWNQVFQIEAPQGIFRLTKRQFYESFANVVASVSYQTHGRYHYRTLPEKALTFRLHAGVASRP